MDTIEQMQHEIGELKKEVLNLKRERGNVYSRTNTRLIMQARLIEWQRIQLERFVCESFDQFDETLWNKIKADE